MWSALWAVLCEVWSSPLHCCLLFSPGCTSWKCRAVSLLRTTLEGARGSAPPTTPPPPIMRIIHPHIYSQRSTAHSNTTMGKPFFFQSTRTYTECCVFFLIYFFLTFKLRVQPTQPQPLCWKSVHSRTFSCLCCKILLLRNVTGFSVMMCSLFDKCTLLVAFAAYLCNHLFMLL